jgi:protein O-mannosyl-transferase
MSKRKKSKNIIDLEMGSETSALTSLPLGMLAGAALIAALGFLVYFPSLSGGFVMDDDQLLTNNIPVKSPDGLYQFWCTNKPVDYWPATNTTFWLEWRLWDMRSTGYHVTNLILHIVESLLIWLILRKLIIPGAFWAAIIFAVHPVNVEATAWIAQRKDMTAMLFFLLSILWYVKELSQSMGMTPIRPHRGPWERVTSPWPLTPSPWSSWYWMSLLAFVLAMLGKGSTAVLPALLLGIIWWTRPLTSRDFVRMAPFFLVGAVLVGVNMWFQRHGSGQVIRAAGIADRLAGAGCMVWFYLYKAVMPIDLSFVYPQWKIEAENLLLWTPLMAALAVTAVLWRHRESWSRPLLFAWGFFCVALVPVLGFTDVGFMKYSLVADRYQHIAIIGVIALAAAGLGRWQNRAHGGANKAATAAALVAVGTLALLTMRQNELYRDAITLYEATLEKNPDCWVAHNNLGGTIGGEGRLPEAMKHFKEAVRLNPNYAEAHSNLAFGLLQSGQYEEAIKHCEKALRLKDNKYPEAHNNLGLALINVGRLPEAIEHFEQALQQNPYYPDAENSLGSALSKSGRSEEALAHFQMALDLKPDFADAQFNMGSVLASLGRYPEAIQHYQRALALNGNDPDYYYFMGVALIETGQPRQALGYLQHALKLMPDAPEFYLHMAMAYAGMQQSSQAIDAVEKALELARAKGKTVLAGQIESWLNSYRAGMRK